MARSPRLIDPDGMYHVICRGNNKAKVFECSDDYEKYLIALGDVKERFGIHLFHYVLMPNHVHLLLRPNGDGLSEFMHAVQMRHAKRFCRKRGFVGHVWQGRFKSLPIDSDSYLLACGNYIEMNPVRAGLVAHPKDWRWSSYRYYALGEENNLIETDPIFESFGKNNVIRRLTYRQMSDGILLTSHLSPKYQVPT